MKRLALHEGGSELHGCNLFSQVIQVLVDFVFQPKRNCVNVVFDEMLCEEMLRIG